MASSVIAGLPVGLIAALRRPRHRRLPSVRFSARSVLSANPAKTVSPDTAAPEMTTPRPSPS